MVEPSMDLSRDGLSKFLDYTVNMGLMSRGTVNNRKKACDTILSILDDSETSDLSGIDIEDVIRRHSVLKAGQFRPATLTGYQGHLRGAIKDFLNYAKNPSTWRPGIKPKVSKTKPATTSKEAKRQEQASKPEAFVEEVRKPKQPSIHIDFHIHISPESTPEQIDKIFDSMSSHFGNRTG